MKNKTHQTGSITLGLVFGLGMLGMAIAASTLLFTTSSVTNNSLAGLGVRSLITADSANREGVHRVLIDYADDEVVTFTGASIPALNNTSGGDVSVTGTWPIYEIRSTSTNSRTTRKIVSILNLFPSAFAFDQAVYTNGELDFNGNVTIEGDIYATDGIEIGGSTDITEDAYTPAEIETSGSGDINGTSVDNYETILPPAIDITPYETIALAESTYGDESLASSNIQGNTNATGTYFIVGNPSISSNPTNFNGTLIVDGNLTLTGGTYTAAEDNPLSIYVTGNLQISGGVDVFGIVYVEGETTFGNGTPEISGALISVNGANKASGGGNVTVTYDPDYAEEWADIIGLETESGTAPKIENWREE